MLVRVDVGDSRTLHEQIAASVRADIIAGQLKPGDRLPSAREVAQALDVNVHTVLRAYQQLRDEGLLGLRRARGAIIAAQAAPLVELSIDVANLVARAEALGVSRATLAAMVAGTGGSAGDGGSADDEGSADSAGGSEEKVAAS